MANGFMAHSAATGGCCRANMYGTVVNYAQANVHMYQCVVMRALSK